MSGRWVTAKKGHRCKLPRLNGARVTELGRRPEEGDRWECECGMQFHVRDERDGPEWSAGSRR